MSYADTTRWGWVSRDGRAQQQTFGTAEAAIAEMKARLGKDTTTEEIFGLGFRLALVEVTVKPLYVMASFDEFTRIVAK